MTARFFRPETGFFLGFWLLALLLYRSQAFNDPGALWHVRVGDHVFAHGFPHTDPFTWAYANQPWVPQQWLAECALSLTHRVGGFDTMLLLLATVLAALAAWLGKRFTDVGLHWMLAALFAGLGLAVASFHFYLRPHVATIVLMAVVMAFLIHFENGRFTASRWLWLVPLSVVWTNVHGGVLGGLVTAGLAAAGWSLLWLLRLDSPVRSGRDLVWIGLGLAGGALAMLVNPFGVEMLRTWWSIVGSTELPRYISEHQPLNFATTDGLAVACFALFYLAMLAGTLPRRPRVTWLLPLVWFALTCKSIRHGPLFCVTALVALADFFPHTFWFRLLRDHGDTLVGPPNTERAGWRPWLLPAMAVLTALTLQVRGTRVPVVGAGWAYLDPKDHPVELTEVLQAYARSRPDGYPVFNDANLGGFLIYFTPTLRVFMDDRCELYGDEGIRRYMDMAAHHPERVEEWLKKAPQPVERLLVLPDTRLEEWLSRESGRYREVARCEKAVLFEVTTASAAAE